MSTSFLISARSFSSIHFSVRLIIKGSLPMSPKVRFKAIYKISLRMDYIEGSSCVTC